MIVFSGNFYGSVLKKLLKKNIITLDSKILVAAGGNQDKNEFSALGFKNITISNLDVRMKADSFKPFKWAFMDVENLKFKDNEFDLCVIHHGLHHCRSPHKGLLELYRTAGKGVLALEGLDNFVTRAGQRLGFSERYELVAVNQNGLKYGGIMNTPVPNFVYRWSKNEIIKTISSYNPECRISTEFFYGLEIPYSRLKKMKSKLKFLISLICTPIVVLSFLIIHKQAGNRFAFFIKKGEVPRDLLPWLKVKKGKIVPDENFFKRKFIKGS